MMDKLDTLENGSGIMYITGKSFKKLNRKAIRNNLNRSVVAKYANGLDDDVKLPLTFVMPHNDREMRCQFVTANPFSTGQDLMKVMIDMTLKDYEKNILVDRRTI